MTMAPISAETLSLRFERAFPADDAHGIVPYRHYCICTSTDDVGRINLRTASTRLTDTVIGHIGFEIADVHRRRGYARLACLALVPDIRRFMPTVLITCDADNTASRRTIEYLGATSLGECVVPDEYLIHSPHSRSKLHFRWTP